MSIGEEWDRTACQSGGGTVGAGERVESVLVEFPVYKLTD